MTANNNQETGRKPQGWSGIGEFPNQKYYEHPKVNG